MKYLYETHLHTSESSACGQVRGADYIAAYLDLGFTGIFVTDHFFNSNCCADRRLPWREWVKQYCRGYEMARNEGEKRGLDVFFGWEETFDADDYLVYGLDMEWLMEHPEMIRWTRLEMYREIRRYGGCVVQAHPFRQHSYIRDIHLAPYFVDAVEAGNAHNHDALYDGLAMEYAKILGLPVVAGSDIHRLTETKGFGPYGVKTETRLTSSEDYAALILSGTQIELHIPENRCHLDKSRNREKTSLKVDIRGRDDVSRGKLREMSLEEIAAVLREEE